MNKEDECVSSMSVAWPPATVSCCAALEGRLLWVRHGSNKAALVGLCCAVDPISTSLFLLCRQEQPPLKNAAENDDTSAGENALLQSWIELELTDMVPAASADGCIGLTRDKTGASAGLFLCLIPASSVQSLSEVRIPSALAHRLESWIRWATSKVECMKGWHFGDGITDQAGAASLTAEELLKKKESVLAWLSSNLLPAEELQDGNIRLFDAVTILPPYNSSSCFSENTLVLAKVQTLLDKLPS